MLRRFIYGLRKRSSITMYLHDLHWLPILFRIKFKVICYVHRVIYDPSSVPVYITSLFELNKRTRCFNLNIPKVKTNFGKRSLKFTGAQLWNSLPLELKVIEEHEIFRSKLKTYYLRSYYYK